MHSHTPSTNRQNTPPELNSASSISVISLPRTAPTALKWYLTRAQMRKMADDVGAKALQRLSFVGEITPIEAKGWQLFGTLRARVTLQCVRTLTPVHIAVVQELQRYYVSPKSPIHTDSARSPWAESLEEIIDLWQLLQETLVLACPQYPMAETTQLPLQSVHARITTDDAIQHQAPSPFAVLKDTFKIK